MRIAACGIKNNRFILDQVFIGNKSKNGKTKKVHLIVSTSEIYRRNRSPVKTVMRLLEAVSHIKFCI